jgi:hypothetical protein
VQFLLFAAVIMGTAFLASYWMGRLFWRLGLAYDPDSERGVGTPGACGVGPGRVRFKHPKRVVSPLRQSMAIVRQHHSDLCPDRQAVSR